MAPVRTRFAPSPTGYLHIGGLRTALYEFLFAKSQEGSFVLRIEDTDKNRFVPGATESLCRILKIFNLGWDEGPEVDGPYFPYIQSQRVASGIYKRYAEQLLSGGHAYYCFCPPQTKDQIKQSHAAKQLILRDPCRNLTRAEVNDHLKRGENPAIRLRLPDNETVAFHDFILKKDISWNTKNVDEVMLLKSDGFPTYQLAVVVDDATMKISHIIRALEWLPSTPVHLLLFKYFGFAQPQIGHVTDILDPSGGKLSKRKGNVSCEDFLAQGYLPEAILNFILLCGWAPKDNREIFSLDEMVSHFAEGNFQTAHAIFNVKKLNWFNGYYLRQKAEPDLINLLRPYAPPGATGGELARILPLIRQRIEKLSDFIPLAGFFWERPSVTPDLFSDPNAAGHLSQALVSLSDILKWSAASINAVLQPLPEKFGWNTGDFFMTLRLAITGNRVTPPLSESLEILGKEETTRRVGEALATLNIHKEET